MNQNNCTNCANFRLSQWCSRVRSTLEAIANQKLNGLSMYGEINRLIRLHDDIMAKMPIRL